jgi:hypothetical protein
MLKFVVGESFDAIISNFFDVDITVVFLQALTHCCPISTWASCYRHYKGLLTPTTQIPICCLSVPLLPILLSPQDACTFIIIFLKRPLRWHWVNFLDSFFFAVLLYRRHQYHQQRIRLQTGKAKGLLLPGYCEYCF